MIQAGEAAELIGTQRDLFVRLANVDGESLEIAARLKATPDQAASVTVGSVKAYLPLAGLVDLSAEIARLQKERENIAQQIARSEGLLAGEGFAQRAPKEVVQRERDKLETMKATHDALEERLKSLG